MTATALSDSFWIAIGTMVCAFMGLVTRYCYKSKCKEVSICCIHIKRDIEEEIVIDQTSTRKASLDISRIPSTTV